MPVSRYRNCFCKETKKDEWVSNFKMTTAAGDHQFIKANDRYFAVALRGGGGPVLLWDYTKSCRVPSGAPKIAGHGGGVTDTDFHPFNQTLLVTGSSDCTVKLWQVRKTRPSSFIYSMKTNRSKKTNRFLRMD